MNSTAIFENPRNHRASTFGRSSSLKPPSNNGFDDLKNAWNGNGSIWRSDTSFLDGLTPSEAIRSTSARQESTSSTKTSSTPFVSLNGHQPDKADYHTKMASTATPWTSGVGSVFRTRDPDFTSPSKQRHDGSSVMSQYEETESSTHLLLNSAPDFDSPANGTIQRKYQGNDNYRFQTNGVSKQNSYLNDNTTNIHHPNFGRFMSNNAMASMGSTKAYTDESSAETGQSDDYSLSNNSHDISRSSLLLQEELPTSLSWTGAPTFDSTHPRTSPKAGNPGRFNQHDAYQNGNFVDADKHVEMVSNSMASFSLSNSNPGRRPSHSPTYPVPRAQHPHQASIGRQHPSSQTRYSHEYHYLDSTGLPHRASTLTELQGVPRQSNSRPFIDYDNSSPAPSDHRSSFHSPYYSATGTPPTGPESVRSVGGSGISSRTSYHDAVILDRKLRNLEPYHSGGVYNQGNAFQGLALNGSHGVSAYQPLTRMNPLAMPYSVNGHLNGNTYTSIPRLHVREPDSAQTVRSPLLEEFRLNNKTNKRYELRDIYDHIVEFSGDQHGSRFIQQKLETANSDEKEQVFSEIQPNCLQLMTDVFGNYVIQKMFEHGNQSQKKMLANTMKNHVLNLSLQMYGCRVVQKAIEHVLMDQQASMVRELDGPNKQILKVIRDQNGNHVVQKAIERVPAEHIQFIVEAHRGEVVKLATHTYGCRVIQRILEHCQPAAKRIILDELHSCVQPLITDSFGNYVVQHIIQNGEPSDRRWVVSIVQQQLLIFSKHKFASNVVEKCIEYADEDQRAEMLRKLTGPNEQGQTPVLSLLRDQYEKICSLLKGHELEMLIGEMRACFSQLKRTSYGKQVMAIEKLLYDSSTVQNPPTGGTRSSDLMSSNMNYPVEKDAGTSVQESTELFAPNDWGPSST